MCVLLCALHVRPHVDFFCFSLVLFLLRSFVVHALLVKYGVFITVPCRVHARPSARLPSLRLPHHCLAAEGGASGVFCSRQPLRVFISGVGVGG